MCNGFAHFFILFFYNEGIQAYNSSSEKKSALQINKSYYTLLHILHNLTYISLKLPNLWKMSEDTEESCKMEMFFWICIRGFILQ